MTLRFANELGFTAAVMIAMLGVLLGGELPGWAWGVLGVPPLSAWLQHQGRYVSGLVGTVLAALASAYSAVVVVQEGVEAALLAGAMGLLGILCGRLLTRRTLSHDLQALLLSLLLMLTGTALHTQITFALVFVAYAVAISWALLARHLVAGAEREARRSGAELLEVTLRRTDIATPRFFLLTGILSIAMLMLTSLLFVVFPRVGWGNLGVFASSIRSFPRDVSLVGRPRALWGSGAVVARVAGLDERSFERGLYLRGPVYDVVTLRGFGRGTPPAGLSRRLPARLGPRRQYDVFAQPVVQNLLLALGPIDRIRIRGGGLANPSLRVRPFGLGTSGEVLASRPLTGPIRYRVTGWLAGPTPLADFDSDSEAAMSDGVRDHYLQLPERLRTELAPLTAQLSAGQPSASLRALALKRHLQGSFEYTLAQPNGDKPEPLLSFLFEDRRGHCEYFATAYAALLRSAGIPSRVVGGFHGGTWDSDAEIVVFSTRDAHAWVEWFEPGVGWVVDDATPAATGMRHVFAGWSAWVERMRRVWDDYVVDFGLAEQVTIASEAAGWMRRLPRDPTGNVPWTRILTAFGVLAVLGGAWWWRRQQTRGPRGPMTLGHQLVATCERLTPEPVPPHLTVREAVSQLLETHPLPPASIDTVREALLAYETEAFGRRPLSAPRRRQLHRALRQIPSDTSPPRGSP